MIASDVVFDSDLAMPLKFNQQSESVIMEISDSLDASEQTLFFSYRQKIADFINSATAWYPLSINRIIGEIGVSGAIRLMRIYVLSEQDQESIDFGLLFRVDFDVEHGRGLKINGGTLNIIEYGLGEIAFL